MSRSRFFLPTPEWQPSELVLTGDEAQHCARVLRRQPGDEIEVFDGAGRVAIAKLTDVGKREVRAQILRLCPLAPSPPRIHLLPTLIKAEPFEWLLEKAVELGATSIQPVITERTVVHLDPAQLDKKLAKWRRQMMEAAKQCHTPFVPPLHAPLPFAEALANLPTDALKLLPSLAESSRTLHGIAEHASQACIVIGPEGDFTPSEETLAQQQGFVPVTLGPLILRAETAAISALAVLAHEMRGSDRL
jgi:16S rRNA (uracil1498-N3)-methyltransferase